MTVYFVVGANRGIGFSLVKQLTPQADKVFASARSPENATELNQWAADHPNVHVVKLDVTSQESILESSKEVQLIVDHIDVLVINAGISNSYLSVLDTTSDVLLEHFKVNTVGPVNVFQAFYPLVKKSEIKQIIFISSLAGSIGQYIPGGVSGYGQSKAALNLIIRAISSELDSEEFTVVAVHPGLVLSDMGTYGVNLTKKKSPELYESFKSLILTPDQSAEALVTLFNSLTRKDNDRFINYDGSSLVW